MGELLKSSNLLLAVATVVLGLGGFLLGIAAGRGDKMVRRRKWRPWIGSWLGLVEWSSYGVAMFAVACWWSGQFIGIWVALVGMIMGALAMRIRSSLESQAQGGGFSDSGNQHGQLHK